MNIQVISAEYVKVTVDKQERELLVESLLQSGGEYFKNLSPTGRFLLSVFSEKKVSGSTEFTLGVDGVKDVLQDLDYHLRNCVRPPIVKLLVLHLQYFMMDKEIKAELLCSDL